MISTGHRPDRSRIPSVDLRLIDFDRSCPVKDVSSIRTACMQCKPFARKKTSTGESIYRSPTDDRSVNADAWAIGVTLIELMRPELMRVIKDHRADLQCFHLQQMQSGCHDTSTDPYDFFRDVEELYSCANLPHLFQAKFSAREQLLSHALVLIRYSAACIATSGLPTDM